MKLVIAGIPVKSFFGWVFLFFVLAGCASGKIKQRQEARERLLQTSGLYCGFVNGEQFPDIEVQLNIEMAKTCNSELPFTLTAYKNPQEVVGLVFCCNVEPPEKKGKPSSPRKAEASAEASKEASEPKASRPNSQPAAGTAPSSGGTGAASPPTTSAPPATGAPSSNN